MKVKVAAFGRQEFLDQLHQIAKDYHTIELIPFTYTSISEVKQLIDQAVLCDVCLFQNSPAYTLVREKLKRRKLPAIVVSLDEYAILTTIYHMNGQGQHTFGAISMDILDSSYIQNIKVDLHLTEDNIHQYVGGKDLTIDITDIMAFHEQLWDEGKIEHVLTVIPEVKEYLLEKGIPVTIVHIPEKNIKDSLEQVQSIFQFKKPQHTQLVAGLIQIPKNRIDQKEKMKQILLKLGKKTNATIVENTNNQFIIIGTQALLTHLKDHYRDLPLLKEINHMTDTPIEIGFGIGLTTRQATEHAIMAVTICENDPHHYCYLINEQMETIGPIGIEKHIDIPHVFQALIHQARLNNELAYHFIDFIKLRNNEPFSAHDVAAYYKVTKRSAERTIHKLISGDVIKIVGEEKPYQKGRPRKLFQLTL